MNWMEAKNHFQNGVQEETPQYGDGGTVQPYQSKNKVDYNTRKQAYNDSSSVYNSSLLQAKTLETEGYKKAKIGQVGEVPNDQWFGYSGEEKNGTRALDYIGYAPIINSNFNLNSTRGNILEDAVNMTLPAQIYSNKILPKSGTLYYSPLMKNVLGEDASTKYVLDYSNAKPKQEILNPVNTTKKIPKNIIKSNIDKTIQPTQQPVTLPLPLPSTQLTKGEYTSPHSSYPNVDIIYNKNNYDMFIQNKAGERLPYGTDFTREWQYKTK